MKKYCCDICRKEIPLIKFRGVTLPEKQFTIDLTLGISGGTLTASSNIHYEVCEQCFEEIKNKIKELKGEV